MYKVFTLFFCLFISIGLYSQKEYSLEYQHGFGKKYNSNSIGGLYEGFSNTGNSSWQIGIHYTFDVFYSDKTTQGVSGLGLSGGYRYGFGYGNSGNLITGIRATFSFLTEKDHNKFTPSIEFGYHHTFNNFAKGGFTTPSLNVGYDIPMGNKSGDYEGFLFIPRIAVGYRF